MDCLRRLLRTKAGRGMTSYRRLVRATLNEVQQLRVANFKGSDVLVIRLLESYSPDESPADLLWVDLPQEASVRDIADLLSLWTWRTDDNGASVMRAAERWIEDGKDPKRINVALNLDTYPFTEHDVRIAKLQRTAEAFPELAQRCQEIIAQSMKWKAQDVDRATGD